MVEFMLNLIKMYGEWGFLFSMLVEGSAFPFVGTFIVISYGFVADLSIVDILVLSIIGAAVYTIGSWLPYYLGYTLENSIQDRLKSENKRKLEKVKKLFTNYGIWSVAISSPLPLGNVVPFAAGLSKMNLFVYSSLTMIGIAPTTFLFLIIGQVVELEIKDLLDIVSRYQIYLLILFFLSAITIYFYKKQKNLKIKKGSM